MREEGWAEEVQREQDKHLSKARTDPVACRSPSTLAYWSQLYVYLPSSTIAEVLQAETGHGGSIYTLESANTLNHACFVFVLAGNQLISTY